MHLLRDILCPLETEPPHKRAIGVAIPQRHPYPTDSPNDTPNNHPRKHGAHYHYKCPRRPYQQRMIQNTVRTHRAIPSTRRFTSANNSTNTTSATVFALPSPNCPFRNPVS